MPAAPLFQCLFPKECRQHISFQIFNVVESNELDLFMVHRILAGAHMGLEAF